MGCKSTVVGSPRPFTWVTDTPRFPTPQKRIMFFSSAIVPLALSVLGAVASPLHSNNKRTIADDVYADLVYYFQYASSAYSDSCANPNGNTLVTEVRTLHIAFELPRAAANSHPSSRTGRRIPRVSLLVMTPARRSWSRFAEVHLQGTSLQMLSSSSKTTHPQA